MLAIHSLRVSLESWRSVRLPLPMTVLPSLNFVHLLRLDGVLNFVRAWDAEPWLVVLGVAATVLVLGALGGAAVGFVTATLFNAGARSSGGLVVELEALPSPPDPLSHQGRGGEAEPSP
ncbi:MAG: hypothetical protein HY332_03900 [Chloroflexi bacterium]|nr:hypothetical protein [Chloroflexota bacterium]